MSKWIREEFKDKRMAQNKTQSELAKELGIDRTEISRIETGAVTSLTKEKLEYILDYMEIDWITSDIRGLKGETGKTLNKKAMKEANWEEPVEAPAEVEVEECTDPEVIEVFENSLMTDDEISIEEQSRQIFTLEREAYALKNLIKSLVRNPDYAHGFKDAVAFMDEVGL